MKHAGKFQRRTPCTSAEAAGGAATTECADNDDANVSKVVPGETFEPFTIIYQYIVLVVVIYVH